MATLTHDSLPPIDRSITNMVSRTPPDHDHFNDYLVWIRSIAQHHELSIAGTSLHDEARQDFDQWDSDELRAQAARAVRQLWSAKRRLVPLTTNLCQVVQAALAANPATLNAANASLQAALQAREAGISEDLAALNHLGETRDLKDAKEELETAVNVWLVDPNDKYADMAAETRAWLAFDLGRTRSEMAGAIKRLQRHAAHISNRLNANLVSPAAIPPSPKRDRQSDDEQQQQEDPVVDARRTAKKPRGRSNQSVEAGAEL